MPEYLWYVLVVLVAAGSLLLLELDARQSRRTK